MDFVNLPLLGAAALVFASVLAGLYSARIGFSFLFVFLLAGVLAGEDGPGGIRFDDYLLVFWVGNVALAVILLDGGLRTQVATFRTGLKPAAVLATLGVALSAGLTGVAASVLLDLDLPSGLLLGAIVGSTDAAAVFALLGRSGVRLNERVAATLEIESGINDPMAVFLTLAGIGLVLAAAGSPDPMPSPVLAFAQQFGGGALIGLGAGVLMAALLRRAASRDAGGGVLALLLVAGGLCVFALAGLVDASGFLAVYLFGLVVAHRAARETAPTLGAMDGYAWLAQAGMFLLLGLLVTPTDLLPYGGPSLLLALWLILVARPLSVALCLWPMRFTRRETLYIAWVGLRGAVPAVLALFPLLAGVPHSQRLFNAAFVVVTVSLLVQGPTIGWMARKLGVALPDPDDTARARLAFGDFALDPRLPMSAVCSFYALPAVGGDPPLADWLQAALRRPPVAGDRVPHGGAIFVVREIDHGRIAAVGLLLEPGDAA